MANTFLYHKILTFQDFSFFSGWHRPGTPTQAFPGMSGTSESQTPASGSPGEDTPLPGSRAMDRHRLHTPAYLLTWSEAVATRLHTAALECSGTSSVMGLFLSPHSLPVWVGLTRHDLAEGHVGGPFLKLSAHPHSLFLLHPVVSSPALIASNLNRFSALRPLWSLESLRTQDS